MCWNAKVSLQSFSLGMLFILIGAVYKVSFPVLLFCGTIVFMQLIEYIVWSNYEDKEINRKASLAAIGLLFLQPIASILTLPSPTQREVFLSAFLVASLVSMFFAVPKSYSMTRAPNGHLAWDWIDKDSTPSLLVYFVFLLTPLLMKQDLLLLGAALATLFLSLYTYHKDNTWGSMWCWIVNGMVPVVIGTSVLRST
jgi:hypothetical protein